LDSFPKDSDTILRTAPQVASTDQVNANTAEQVTAEVPKRLSSTDIMLSVASRYPDEGRRQKLANFLKEQQDALNGISNGEVAKESPRPPKKSTNTKLTKMDIMLSLAKHFSTDEQRQKLAMFLQEQQAALREIETNESPTEKSPKPDSMQANGNILSYSKQCRSFVDTQNQLDDHDRTGLVSTLSSEDKRYDELFNFLEEQQEALNRYENGESNEECPLPECVASGPQDDVGQMSSESEKSELDAMREQLSSFLKTQRQRSTEESKKKKPENKSPSYRATAPYSKNDVSGSSLQPASTIPKEISDARSGASLSNTVASFPLIKLSKRGIMRSKHTYSPQKADQGGDPSLRPSSDCRAQDHARLPNSRRLCFPRRRDALARYRKTQSHPPPQDPSPQVNDKRTRQSSQHSPDRDDELQPSIPKRGIVI
jgi:dsDNA-binding SOS-regulon protein